MARKKGGGGGGGHKTKRKETRPKPRAEDAPETTTTTTNAGELKDEELISQPNANGIHDILEPRASTPREERDVKGEENENEDDEEEEDEMCVSTTSESVVVVQEEEEEEEEPQQQQQPVIKLVIALKNKYELADDAEATMRIEVLEEVVDDLKLELDGYRAAARELAIEIEAKERALENLSEALEFEKTTTRARAVREATERLEARLAKAEKAIERERADGERGRVALDALREMEIELERRMLSQDDFFERKWAERVEQSESNARAFRDKLALVERDMHQAKMDEESARSELARAVGEIKNLKSRLLFFQSNAADYSSKTPVDIQTDDAGAGEEEDDKDAPPPPPPPRRGFFSFITGVPSEVYTGPKIPTSPSV
jgi:chromosome segregation ATPase